MEYNNEKKLFDYFISHMNVTVMHVAQIRLFLKLQLKGLHCWFAISVISQTEM